MSKIRDQVKESHTVLEIPVVTQPSVPDEKRIRLRARLIGEEFVGLLDAMGFDAYAVSKVALALGQLKRFPLRRQADLVAIADACADLYYVIFGTELEFWIDGDPVLDAVHESNMAKLGGPVREESP